MVSKIRMILMKIQSCGQFLFTLTTLLNILRVRQNSNDRSGDISRSKKTHRIQEQVQSETLILDTLGQTAEECEDRRSSGLNAL